MMAQALLHRLLSTPASAASWVAIGLHNSRGRMFACKHVPEREYEHALRLVASGRSVEFAVSYTHPEDADRAERFAFVQWHLGGEAQLPAGARRIIVLASLNGHESVESIEPGNTIKFTLKWSP